MIKKIVNPLFTTLMFMLETKFKQLQKGEKTSFTRRFGLLRWHKVLHLFKWLPKDENYFFFILKPNFKNKSLGLYKSWSIKENKFLFCELLRADNEKQELTVI